MGIHNDRSDKTVCFGENGESERYVLHRTARSIALANELGIEVVTFSGTRFDVPFLNYRNAVHRLPKVRPDKHVDIQKLLPRQDNGHPASLEKSCKRYGIGAKATPYSDELWTKARLGDREALKLIGQHCREDVLSLRDLSYVVWHEADEMEEDELPFLDDLNEDVLDELDAVRQFEYEGAAAVHPDDKHPLEYVTEITKTDDE